MFKTTVLMPDHVLHISCYSREHADQIAASLPGAIDVCITPATQTEIEIMQFAGVLPGGTLQDRLRIDDFFARLEVACR
jgi:hypothetical protein